MELMLSFSLNPVCRFGLQAALASRPRDAGRWIRKKKKKFTVSLLVPCIPVSFSGMHDTIYFSEPSDDCPMHFYRKFLITFGGKAEWRGLTYLDENWNLSSGFCSLSALEVALFQCRFVGFSYLMGFKY